MTKSYFLIAVIILLISCDDATSDAESGSTDLQFTQFDVTLSSGEKSIGVIDEDNKLITLSGVTEPLDIVSVDYVCSDEVTLITPTPESKIDAWGITENFRLHASSGYQDYTVKISDYEAPTYTSQATISPLETFGTKVMYHILDLNGDANKAKDENTASVAFGEKAMNGIRFPLYCGDYYGGHPEPGVVVESVYDKPMKSLENAKKYYSGSEPFMIFLGIKCMTSDKNEYYPDWVSTEEDYMDPHMYAQLILDFITFMDSKGHEVGALAIDKESVRMGVEDFKESVDSIRAMTQRLGFTTPKIVAPELLDPQGDKSSGWMNTLYDKGYQDRFDIFGNHYYQRDHTVAGFAKLKYEFDLAQSDKVRPAWATEPHWNGDGELFGAESALGCMFDHTDLGLDAFMWWGYPIVGSGSAKSCVMRAFSDAIHRSIPIRMLDHDGEETLTPGKLHTRAYLRGDEVNVFLINIVNPNKDLTPVSYEDYAIGILDGYQIDGKVTFRQWREDTDNDTYDPDTKTDEGELIKIDPVEENQFLVDLPTGSVTQLTFNITE